MFPPTIVKGDEALPETADCRMDLTVDRRWGYDGPVEFCNPVLRSVISSFGSCRVLQPSVAFGELKLPSGNL